MLYPFGWVAPDLQAPPQAKLPHGPRFTVNQPMAATAQASAAQSLAAANRPTVAAAPARPSLSGAMVLAQAAPAPEAARQSTDPSGGSRPKPDSVLRLGSRNEAVQTLQTRLKALNYYPGPVDGIFGPLTHQAVQKFQQDETLPVDGQVGQQTWQRLQDRSRPTPAVVVIPPAVTVAPDPAGQLTRPAFTPAMVPTLTFHPMGSAQVNYDPRPLWMVVIVIATVGGGLLGFRPEPPTQPPTPPPPRRGPGPLKGQTIHRPQAVYPARPAASADPNQNSATAVSPETLNHRPPAAVAPPALPPAAASTATVSDLEADLRRLSQTSPWATDATAAYLTTFLYDLQEPDSRQQLENAVQDQDAPVVAEHAPETAPLSALWRCLGKFPERHHRTGQAYTYLLLDDMGGCFRLCNTELWVTQAALRWLSDDIPYPLTIRRLDPSGRVTDKAFTVQLNSYEMPVAS